MAPHLLEWSFHPKGPSWFRDLLHQTPLVVVTIPLVVELKAQGIKLSSNYITLN